MRAFIGIDPAMANTGVALYFEGGDDIITALIQEKADVKGFENIYLAGSSVADQVGNMVLNLSSREDVDQVLIVMEYPPPTGIWAPGLYAVDSLVLGKLHDSGTPEIYLAHPTRIDTLLVGPEPETPVQGMTRKVKFTKPERRDRLMEILDANGLRIQMSPRMPKPPTKPLKSGKERPPPKPKVPAKLTPDESDACLLLSYLLFNMTDRLTLPEGLLPERWELKETPCRRRK